MFTTFKLRNLFSVKDSVPRELRSRVIYKFTCAGCNACYIGETGRHFSTRVREHLSSDKSSHIFKHLLNSECCCHSCSTDCFGILDSASTKFQLKLKTDSECCCHSCSTDCFGILDSAPTKFQLKLKTDVSMSLYYDDILCNVINLPSTTLETHGIRKG